MHQKSSGPARTAGDIPHAYPSIGHLPHRITRERTQAHMRTRCSTKADPITSPMANSSAPRLDRLAARARIACMRDDMEKAEQLGQRVLVEDASHADALGTLGIVALKARRLDAALDLLTRAAARAHEDATVHTHLGAAWLLLGDPQRSLDSIERALDIDARGAIAWNVRACALGSMNRHEAAIEDCDRALSLQPDYAAALVNRGNAQAQLGRLSEALGSFERALACDPASAQSANNCGNVLKALGRPEDALLKYQLALQLQPAYAEAAYNVGVVLSELGRPREAIESYLRALELAPDYLDARHNLAHCRLQLGDFRRGWIAYEAQSQRLLRARGGPRFLQPRWNGVDDLAGRTILLHADAGLGDTLQFCRYAEILAEKGARVLIEVQRPLVPLLRELPGAQRVIATCSRLPRFDVHCPIMDLPAVLEADLDTIPARIPYIRASAPLVSRWRKCLAATAPRIGLVWSGNPAHENDANRSLALSALEPMFSFEATWISLQKEIRPADLEAMARRPGLLHFGDRLRSFADTAALIANLDLVVAVDTSVAHLVGAMGKPLWLLLPFNPDWRWLMRRTDSPWYPTARLFRQTRPGDWARVVTRVARTLRQHPFPLPDTATL